jgi:hypothetical protein
MVLNITTAFIEQIIVDRAFFVNRHEPAQYAMVNLETLGGNGDGGSAVDFEDIPAIAAISACE